MLKITDQELYDLFREATIVKWHGDRYSVVDAYPFYVNLQDIDTGLCTIVYFDEIRRCDRDTAPILYKLVRVEWEYDE